MTERFIQFIQVMYQKGYIELAVITLGTWLYNLFHKKKKKKYTRIKCPKCNSIISLKDGKPYTPKKTSK